MSLTISLQFPAGRYLAVASNRDDPEWPPHPARLTLGLIDVLHRRGNNPADRKAISELAAISAPIVAVSDPSPSRDPAATVYVPQNVTPKVGDLRSRSKYRKPRSFPVLRLDPDTPSVFFHWDSCPAKFDRKALASLLADLPRFGHSSSLVIARVESALPSTGLTQFSPVLASDYGSPDALLRVPFKGLLEAAEAAFDAKGRSQDASRQEAKYKKTQKISAAPRGRYDPPHRWQGYRTQSPASCALLSRFDPDSLLILTRTGGSHLGSESIWQVAKTLHKAILERCPDPVPEWISGHRADGTPLAADHLAIVPLPFVGQEHSDSRMLGIGLLLPRPEVLGLKTAEMSLVMRSLLGELFREKGELKLVPPGRPSWSWTLRPREPTESRTTLNPSRWRQASSDWATVTPIIFPNHPKPRLPRKANAENWSDEKQSAWQASCLKIITGACAHQGLPAPTAIQVGPMSLIPGVSNARSFAAPSARPGRPARFHSHCRITFDEPIQGPLILGAGRYRGYGLCLPVPSRTPTSPPA